MRALDNREDPYLLLSTNQIDDTLLRQRTP